MVLMWRVARRDRDAPHRFVASMIALLCAVVLRVVAYRADIWHYPAMLWAPLLALVFAHARHSSTEDRRFLGATPFATGVVFSLCSRSSSLGAER